MSRGRVARAGPAAEVLSDPEAVPFIGIDEAGAVLPATIVGARRVDGAYRALGERGAAPASAYRRGGRTALSLRIHAEDVIIATEKPTGLSALNILPATVTAVHEGEGPGAAVGLRSGTDRLLARVTRSAVRALGLAPASRATR